MKQKLLLAIVVCTQLLGAIVTQLVIIKFVGVGDLTDAYVAAQAAPTVIIAIISSSLQHVWLPRLSILLDNKKAWLDEQAIAQGQAALLGGGLIIITALSLPLWANYLFPGFSPSQITHVHLYSWPLLAAAVFNIQSILLTVALRARNRFLIAEFIALLGTLFALAAIPFVLPVWGLQAVAWTALIRAMAVFIILMALAGWPALSVKKGWQCKTAWRMMKPLLFSACIYKTHPLVDRYWASQVSSGGVTVFSLAQTAINALSTILQTTLCVPLTPSFARYVRNEDFKNLKKNYRKGVLHVTLVVLLCAALFVLAKPLIQLFLISLLDFSLQAATQMYVICLFLFGFLYAATATNIVLSVYYALGDSKTPAYIGLFGFAVGLVLKWLLFKPYGINGIAIATSCYFMLNFLFFITILEHKLYRR